MSLTHAAIIAFASIQTVSIALNTLSLTGLLSTLEERTADMDIKTPFWRSVQNEWSRFELYRVVDPEQKFKVYHKDDQVRGIDWWSFYISPDKKHIAFRIDKHHWAKGRKMKIESDLREISSGTYVIIEKAKSNSYDSYDYLVVELVPLVLDTPRKALNWLERELSKLEAKDGKTTEDLVREMNVRGY
jgi:hypothetical protein